jgi:hypothetical protein
MPESKAVRVVGLLDDLQEPGALQNREDGRDVGFERVREQRRLETAADHGRLGQNRAVGRRQRLR